MQTTKVRVTPDLAQRWLEGNTHNRQLRQSTVERYARDMEAGKWRLTHQGIAFNGNGTLIDGQHRLWAVFTSGASVEMMVTTGLDMEAQEVIDGGEVRQARDVLSLRGEKVTPLLVGVAKLLCQQLTGNYAPTRTETVETFDQYSEAIHFAGKAFPRRVKGICIAPVLTPITRAYYAHNSADLLVFARVLSEGVMEDGREQPIVLLRNWLLEKAPKRAEVYGKTERALYAYLMSEKIKTLYAATDELFPLPAERRKLAAKRKKG